MVAATVSPNNKDFLQQRLGTTNSFFYFCKQAIFTYPLSNNFNLICVQNSNLSSSQSVVRCEYEKDSANNSDVDMELSIVFS